MAAENFTIINYLHYHPKIIKSKIYSTGIFKESYFLQKNYILRVSERLI